MEDVVRRGLEPRGLHRSGLRRECERSIGLERAPYFRPCRSKDVRFLRSKNQMGLRGSVLEGMPGQNDASAGHWTLVVSSRHPVLRFFQVEQASPDHDGGGSRMAYGALETVLPICRNYAAADDCFLRWNLSDGAVGPVSVCFYPGLFGD